MRRAPPPPSPTPDPGTLFSPSGGCPGPAPSLQEPLPLPTWFPRGQAFLAICPVPAQRHRHRRIGEALGVFLPAAALSSSPSGKGVFSLLPSSFSSPLFLRFSSHFVCVWL